jgi:hypothetical protein
MLVLHWRQSESQYNHQLPLVDLLVQQSLQVLCGIIGYTQSVTLQLFFSAFYGSNPTRPKKAHRKMNLALHS